MSEEAQGGAAIPPIDFTTFVLSMSTSCMIHLGQVEGPEGPDLNLPMARQVIDILEMLEDKTQSNLTGDEERIFSQILSDLRDAYEHAAA